MSTIRAVLLNELITGLSQDNTYIKSLFGGFPKPSDGLEPSVPSSTEAGKAANAGNSLTLTYNRMGLAADPGQMLMI